MLALVMNRLMPHPLRATSTAAAPLRRARARRAEYGAGMVASPGSDRPSASMTQPMELAVKSPAHEPQVGQTRVLELGQVGLATSGPLKYLPNPSKMSGEADLAAPVVTGQHGTAGDHHAGHVQPRRAP